MAIAAPAPAADPAVPHGQHGHIVFLDTETTGLVSPAERPCCPHEVWEVAVIIRDPLHRLHDVEREWQLPVDPGTADPAALALNGFYDRWVGHDRPELLTDLHSFARAFAWLTADRTAVVGSNPQFNLVTPPPTPWRPHPMTHPRLDPTNPRKAGGRMIPKGTGGGPPSFARRHSTLLDLTDAVLLAGPQFQAVLLGQLDALVEEDAMASPAPQPAGVQERLVVDRREVPVARTDSELDRNGHEWTALLMLPADRGPGHMRAATRDGVGPALPRRPRRGRPMKSWTDIAPEDALDLDLRGHPEIEAPFNEMGERCPWPWDPQQLFGTPLGQYHCPYCGAMVVAGIPHLDYRDLGVAPTEATQ